MKIVTALYELFRCENLGHYKAFREGLLLPFMQLPKDKIKYVVYTNKATNERYNVSSHLAHPNIEIRFKELNESEFCEAVVNVKKQYEDNPDHYRTDKHLCVTHYMELMFEKFNFVIDSITPDDDVVLWLDGGLFFNSCNFPWRNYVFDHMNRQEFFDKLYEKIKYDFTIIKSDHMSYHYMLAQSMATYVTEVKGENSVVSGGLWGGKAEVVKEVVLAIKENCKRMLEGGLLISDQECTTLEYMKDPSKFNIFYFGDWYDYQRPLLEIYDQYDPNNYDHQNCNLEYHERHIR